LASGRRQTSRNFESGTTAYDMKSLGKHLEAGPLDQLHLSPREEMETNLIRSLIASYFGIVRQTIQDLVPKAIMHLLVGSLPCLIIEIKGLRLITNFRSTFRVMLFNRDLSRRFTSLISLLTCYLRTRHWYRRGHGSRRYWTRTRRLSRS
jgi:hypothetical protein